MSETLLIALISGAYTIGGAALITVWNISSRVAMNKSEHDGFKKNIEHITEENVVIRGDLSDMKNIHSKELGLIRETLIETNTTLKSIKEFLQTVNADTRQNKREIEELRLQIAKL